MEHGALEYRECVAQDLAPGMGGQAGTPSFPRMTRLKPGETVLFSWIEAKNFPLPKSSPFALFVAFSSQP